MKMFKKFFFGAMIAAPLLLAPATTKAGPISDLLHLIFGGGNDRKQPGQNPPANQQNAGTPTTGTGNSVPINGGLVVLLVAGLGLGAKVVYDSKSKKMIPAVI